MRLTSMVFGALGVGIALAATSGGCSSTTSANDAGQPTNCQALRACCDKLPAGSQTSCLAEALGSEAECQSSKASYCAVDSAACTKLETCCAGVGADKKSLCDVQVSTSAGDVVSCQKALNGYPSCAGAVVDSGAPDTGGGGGGGGKAACDALGVCCGKLPDPAKGRCAEIVGKSDGIHCENVKDNYCGLDPKACTKLQECCPTLGDEDKSACEFQVSNFGTDVELCGVALKKYPSCAP